MTKSPVWLAAFNAALGYYTAHLDECCGENPIKLAFQLADRAEEMAQKRYPEKPKSFDRPPPIPVSRKPW